MTGLGGIDEAHAAVAAVDASFENAGRRRGVLHDRNQQKDYGSEQNTGNSGTTH
jgi:hypothetical protein